jgi:hypothetical protein
LIAVNFFTAYLLQTIGRLKESLNFVAVAERMLFKLLMNLKPENMPATSSRIQAAKLKVGGILDQSSPLELIHEEGVKSPAESQGGEAA